MKALLKRLFKFTSFKAGLIMVVLCLVWYVWCSSQGGKFHKFIKALDNRVVDLMFRIRGDMPTTGDVVVVDLDEKSLQEIGQWPWSRSVVGDMLLKIGAHGPRVIGLDIFFPEADRTSRSRYVPYFEKLTGQKLELPEEEADNDLVLCRAMEETPTIVGYVFLMPEKEDEPEPDEDAVRPCPQFSWTAVGDDAKLLRGSRIVRAREPVLNIPTIGDGAMSEGYFNMIPDASGMVRKVPLFMRFGNTLYPSLNLEMLREGLEETDAKPVFGELFGQYGLNSVGVGEYTLPTDLDGQMWVNFRGRQKTFPYYSASDIIKGRVSPSEFKDKFVVVGTSAAGLLDLRSTPFDNAFPGVEVHANVLDNAIAGDAMRHDVMREKGIIMTLIIAGGLILTALLSYTGPIAGGVGGLLILAVVGIGNYSVFFLRNQLVGVTYSLVALLGIFIVVTLVNYFLEGRQKRVIRGMFSTMVSGDVLKYMEDNPGTFSLAGEQRQATMFFSDVAGFTTISESLTPADLVLLLNAYLTPMTEIIMDLQGYVDKYEGDAIMAEWGVPFPSEDHAQLACLAALEQQARLAAIREELYERFGHRLFVRMGMNSGAVSAGNMGSTRRFSYTVMGDAVNQAARFEPANKDYDTDIMMGASTYELAKDHIEARMLDKIIVKGKTEPITIYELIANKGDISDEKAEVVGLYHEALEIHWERDFEGAIVRLEKALTVDAKDGPCKALLARINGYKEAPPGDDWQGEYVRKSKD